MTRIEKQIAASNDGQDDSKRLEGDYQKSFFHKNTLNYTNLRI